MKRKKPFIVIIILFLQLFLFNDLSVIGKNAISYNKEGWLYLKKGDNYKAIFSFKNSLERNPNYKNALLGLGRAYYEVEAYDKSVELFDTVLKLDKNSDGALVGLGLSFVKLAKYTQALNYFNRAEKISEENIDAKYGIAYLYYSMNKLKWAERKLKNIFRMNPYHFDSIILLADIKSSMGRFNEAKKLAEKAIDIDNSSPKGFIKFGEILFFDYLKNENSDSVDEAINSLNNALSIQPASYHANRILGNIYLKRAEWSGAHSSLEEQYYSEAVNYFNRAYKVIDNSTILYSLAISYDMANKPESAMKYFLSSYKKSPYDTILSTRFEDFLVFRDFKVGHPARIMLNREYYSLALNRIKKNLPDESILYLKRALLLNPMDVNPREKLMEYYSALDYNRFYINEIKQLLRMYPERKYKDRLKAAIYKRRKKLYHKEGYSSENPRRDVPRLLVMNFESGNVVTPHPDAGTAIGSMLTFTLGQFGRMVTVGIRKRNTVARGLRSRAGYLEKSMEKIGDKIKSGDLKQIDNIVYGNYYEGANQISIDFKVMDFHKGVVIGRYNLSESGKENLYRLCIRAARKIYNLVPYRGRVLKLKEKGIIVNLGLFDGIKPGEKLVIYKYNNSSNRLKIKDRMIFTVKEADTLVSFAEPRKKSDLDEIFSSDFIYPLKKRRAKMIE